MMDYKTIIFEKKGGIGYVTMNRPEVLNAINAEVLGELSDVFDTIRADDEIQVIIITGAGRSFIAGADIAEMKTMTPIEGRAFMLKGQAVMRKIENSEKPIIAAVNGFALGAGCELACACDLRFASESAKFGQPEVNLGIIPGFGGTQRLPRLIGQGIAKMMIFGGEQVDGRKARNIGLVERVFPDEELLERTEAFAKIILNKAPIAVKMAKVSIDNGLNTDLRTGVNFEAEASVAAFGSEDRAEGMGAFLEKRKPTFKNR
jgi:enoyl-CoA hydratase